MDKNMFYRDLTNSAGADGHFSKTVMPFSDKDCEDYISTLKELEAEGRVLLEECSVQESKWDKALKMKGFIVSP